MIYNLLITSLKLLIKFFLLVDNSLIMLLISGKANDNKELALFTASD